MLIWIIDEEWSDYEIEKEFLKNKYKDVEIKISNYNYDEDLKNFGYKADGILAQVYADLPKDFIERLENCKVISTYGGGYDRINLEACKEKNITVTNIQDYCSEDLADYTVAAIYLANKKIYQYAESVKDDIKNGLWGQTAVKSMSHRLNCQNLLIYGLGSIGTYVAKKAAAVGLNVYAYDEFLSEEEIEKKNVKPIGLEEGLKIADYLSINLKGVEANRNKINYEVLQKMKPSSYIINTSRGKVINEKDLIRAVNENLISGAILDVVDVEPPEYDDPIFNNDKILITPHISYISIESFRDLKEFALGNLSAVLDGKKPRDLVI